MAALPVLMADLVDRLTVEDSGVLATMDPIEAANNRPCLLIAPPVLDYLAGTFETSAAQLRIFAIAGSSRWGLDAVDQLSTLLDHAEGQLEELQRAEPTLYRITESQQAPAYVLTLSTL